MSKEMLGGCCVCSDERGWTENPLVYCDGQGCSVAVHQACYGIVSVPTGPWFCRKCESQERAVRVKCELCPSKDGALKRTDTNGWAHVVCALYIPEVRFGNVTTMEPIILTLIPQERFSRTCYICQEQGKATKATSGACMQCNKVGCKQQFHVTCAQALGLLCEEAGNYMDNVKYCGYCQHHNSKLKKGAHVKSVPPYKPIATEESPEKEVESNKGSSAKKKSYLAVKPSLTIGKPKSHSPSPDVGSIYNMDIADSEGNGSGAGVTLKIGTTSSHATDSGSGAAAPLAPATDQRNKFTTSNFIETVVTQSEPVFGSDSKSSTSPDNKSKKRKSSIAGVKTETTETTSSFTPISSASQAQNSVNPAASKNLSVTLSHVKTTIASSTAKAVPTPSGGGKTTTAPSPSQPKSNLAVYGTGTKITIAATREDPKKSKPEGVATSVVKGPLTSGSSSALPMTENSPTLTQDVSHEHVGNKRQRSGSQEKGRKPKRPQNRRPAGNVKEELDSPPGSPDQSRRKKANVKEEKDVKPLQTVSAPHMLGNQLNPASSMAQKMHDSLHQEVEAHSIYSQDNSTSSLVGAPLPRKFRASTNDKTLSAANSLLSLGNSTTTPSSAPGTSTFSTSVAGQAAGTQPQGLEQLLERQWEQGNQFLMEQAQHFDIASLLSCLHQLKSENLKLEDHVNALQQRREHLLAVNARLNIPLGGPHTAAVPSSTPDIAPEVRTNGGDAHSFPAQLHISPSPPMRNPAMANAYNNAQARRPVVSQYQQYPGQPPQMGATGNPQSLGMRRDDQHQM